MYGVSGSRYGGKAIGQPHRLAGGEQHRVLPTESGIGTGRPIRDDLESQTVDVEVMRLVVRVLNRPQLGGAGADHGVDSRHLHLLTVDLAAVELKGPASHHMIKGHRGSGIQLFWNATARSQARGQPGAATDQDDHCRRHHWSVG